MRVIFYSDRCEYSQKMLQYINKNNINYLFTLINIDTNTNIPKEIDIVPTIIDSELNQPLKGKKAFEYVINLKYFNNPTNNIEYIKDLPPNPEIPEDEKANSVNTLNLEISKNEKSSDSFIFYKNNQNKNVNSVTQEMNQMRQEQDKIITSEKIPGKKLSLLLQLKNRK
jgi:hypothetical protein